MTEICPVKSLCTRHSRFSFGLQRAELVKPKSLSWRHDGE